MFRNMMPSSESASAPRPQYYYREVVSGPEGVFVFESDRPDQEGEF